jgi:hypothetical protein
MPANTTFSTNVTYQPVEDLLAHPLLISQESSPFNTCHSFEEKGRFFHSSFETGNESGIRAAERLGREIGSPGI